jgi:tellurite resistance protein TerA
MSEGSSKQAILDATKSRAKFSGHDHGKAMGAAGFISPLDENQPGDFLSKPGQTAIVNPTEEGIADFEIGLAWDNVKTNQNQGAKKLKKKGFFDKLFGNDLKREAEERKARRNETAIKKFYTRKTSNGVDLDIGCLYELKNGKKGAIQAFGEMFGNHDEEPYIALSGDERTGETEGEDEVIRVNGKKWDEFKRIVIYVYIYGGADNWNEIQPQVQVRVPGERPLVVSLSAKRDEFDLCAVAGLENVRRGIKMTNFLEYFPGHAAMDRAFGFGLKWEDGEK